MSTSPVRPKSSKSLNTTVDKALKVVVRFPPFLFRSSSTFPILFYSFLFDEFLMQIGWAFLTLWTVDITLSLPPIVRPLSLPCLSLVACKRLLSYDDAMRFIRVNGSD
jgi:hypothetical protein